MRKMLSVLLCVLLIFAIGAVSCFAVSESSQCITETKTVTENAGALYVKKFGVNYKAAPTPPLVVGDTLIVVSGVKLYKLNAKNGKEITSVKMAGSTFYATVSPAFAEGKIFVQLDGGIVQAFDYETMKSLWIYRDPLGGQALCPITYSDETIYTGFWISETDKANYVALNVKDENPKREDESKKALWTYTSAGGFYWSGCAVTDQFVVLGKDNASKDSTSPSQIVSLNRKTGKCVSSLSVKGDIRSSVTYSSETDAYYVSSKAGYIYMFKMNGSDGKLSSLKSFAAPGAVTVTPVIYKGRLYAGCQKGSGGEFLVLNAVTMKKVYSAAMTGYPQGNMLVSTGYEKETGKIYIYSTYNKSPGGLMLFTDSAGQKEPVSTELFVPDSDSQQFSISSVSTDDKGNLYYKNDSGCIFAVGEKKSTAALWLSILVTMINILVAVMKKILFR
ncbi:MAG: PQQ-binding-like beta-propeller repeat protein [Acutalibacteraceae bacterium]